MNCIGIALLEMDRETETHREREREREREKRERLEIIEKNASTIPNAILHHILIIVLEGEKERECMCEEEEREAGKTKSLLQISLNQSTIISSELFCINFYFFHFSLADPRGYHGDHTYHASAMHCAAP